MSSHTEINTDGEKFGVLSTPKTMFPLHLRGRSGRLHEKLLLGEVGNRHDEQSVNTQFRISEKLAKN